MMHYLTRKKWCRSLLVMMSEGVVLGCVNGYQALLLACGERFWHVLRSDDVRGKSASSIFGQVKSIFRLKRNSSLMYVV